MDQTTTLILGWVDRLANAGIDPQSLLPQTDSVHILMGGVDAGKWLETPERPAVIVGTQDMLLSRALMRGYASPRSVWPMEFGVLHHDSQWIFDEVQLMGEARATSAQLEAFRHQDYLRTEREDQSGGRPCRSLWISATLEPEWLTTVDHKAPTEVLRVDPVQEADDRLLSLVRAKKNLRCFNDGPESLRNEEAYLLRLAQNIVECHQSGKMTLVIVNQVRRAQSVYRKISRILTDQNKGYPLIALIHSRFRPADRAREMNKILDINACSDIIVIATQAVEAGVDISAAVLFTELAPWTSMVQRFGRANRRAEIGDGADVIWINILGNLDGDEKVVQKHEATLSLPYEASHLRESRSRLRALTDAAPAHLPPVDDIAPSMRVIRRKDLDDLFDTDSDLSGFEVDISAYIRDEKDTDVRIFWRKLPVSGNTPVRPHSRELCAVPIGMARKWIKGARDVSKFFVRNPQWRRGGKRTSSGPPGWVPLRSAMRPGLTILADVQAGGYDEHFGFTGNRKHIPSVVDVDSGNAISQESTVMKSGLGAESDVIDEDPRSETGRAVPLALHLNHVANEVRLLGRAVGQDELTLEVLSRAGYWHDLGKAHEVFQETMRRGLNAPVVQGSELWAKTVKKNLRHGRAYFRHELASALAFLASERWSRNADLVAYLIAAHHGKVRMNLRPYPRETPPEGGQRFARGIWQGDELPPFDAGGGHRWPGGELILSIMDLGWDELTRESWTERTRDLLSRVGPFRLAWLETLLRIADWRASGKEASGAYADA